MISLGALEAGDGGIFWVANDTQKMYEQAVQQGDLEMMLMLEHRATDHDGGPCTCKWATEGVIYYAREYGSQGPDVESERRRRRKKGPKRAR